MRSALAIVMVLAACRETPSPPAAEASGRSNPNARPHVHPTPTTSVGDRAFYRSTFSKTPDVAATMKLGAELFRDPSLSASGKLACSSCHDPANAFAPSTDLPFQRGGVDGKSVGTRAAPSLRYLQSVPPFSEHYHDSDLNDGADQGPAGGLDWDGRAASLHDQARSPLFASIEMANPSPAALAKRIREQPFAARFREIFGDDVLATDDQAIKALLVALEAYQQDPAQFYPYTSKLDDVLRGRAKLTTREARGLALFDDPAKGNCARCHPSSGAHPVFTDYGFIALGVPGSNAGDLGLCGPLRTDLASHREYCGMFRTPSLRNVGRRHSYFHNGSVKSLTEVVRFYSTRDSNPERWPTNLPGDVRPNLDRDPPFGSKTPRLTDEEIGDIVAFLRTLDDA